MKTTLQRSRPLALLFTALALSAAGARAEDTRGERPLSEEQNRGFSRLEQIERAREEALRLQELERIKQTASVFKASSKADPAEEFRRDLHLVEQQRLRAGIRSAHLLQAFEDAAHAYLKAYATRKRQKAFNHLVMTHMRVINLLSHPEGTADAASDYVDATAKLLHAAHDLH